MSAVREPPGEAGPELSVILASETLELSLETISHLRAQTAASKIELMLGIPGGVIDERHEAELDGFHSVRAIDIHTTDGLPAARAEVIKAASAPVVVLAETHCFPQPEWAEALIEAHRGPWAGVGPEIDNENPGPASWGNILVDYSVWIAPITTGPAADIPGHNSSYKRSLVLEYGDDLAEMLAAESILHYDLRARGHQLYMESRAKVRHRNINQIKPALVEHFYNGRTFGAERSRHWRPLHRAIYALGSPLIPLLRISRIFSHLRQKGRLALMWPSLPMMLGSLVAHATGEMTGYLRGRGNALSMQVPFEIERDRWLVDADSPREERRVAEPAAK